MLSSPDRTIPTSSVIIPFLFLFLIILLIPNGVTAQSSNDTNADPNFSLCMAIIVVFMGLFIASFSVYIRYCSHPSSTNNGILSVTQANAATRGLDHSAIETFPTFTYAEVKDHKIRKEDLECAVCLNEFEDTETLRLIPKCDHVFHPECIDAWLESHVTCPVCRANLDLDSGTDQVPEEGNQENNGEGQTDDAAVQVVCENPPETQEPVRPSLNRNPNSDPNRFPRNGSIKRSRGVLGLGRFRSNSTGHSGVNLERFTLRLTEENRKEMMDRALLNRARSYAAQSSTKGLKTGSSKGGRSYRHCRIQN